MSSTFRRTLRRLLTPELQTPAARQPAADAPQLSSRPALSRDEAVRRLNLIIGRDLRELAEEYGVRVWKAGRKNKGWAGHVLERHLGLRQNSRQSPDFGDWDLKLVSLRRDASGSLRVKETMAITMLEPAEVVSNRFEDSHLHDKLRRLVVAARVFESEDDARSLLHSVATFDLSDAEIFRQVRADYELIRRTIRERGERGVTSDLGRLVQARTKGRGHGSATRAFYARSSFVALMLNSQKLAGVARVHADTHADAADADDAEDAS